LEHAQPVKMTREINEEIKKNPVLKSITINFDWFS